MWVTDPPHIEYFNDGVEIMANSSGSHHKLRGLYQDKLRLIRDATSKGGGVYMFCNLKGGDGSRIYFDGSASICMNGVVYDQCP